MVRFTDPATSESPSGTLPTNQRLLEELTPAQVAAIMRSIDEALIDAQRLRGLPQGMHLELSIRTGPDVRSGVVRVSRNATTQS
jgi:hypothetical protein